MVFALAAAITAGIALAIQGAANAALAVHIGRFEAALVSFLGGTLALLVVSLLLGDIASLKQICQVPFWQLLGGLYGVIVVVAIIYGTSLLGAALTFAAFMFGQLFFGMLVDCFGLFGVQILVLKYLRINGCLFVAKGIGAVYRGRIQEKRVATEMIEKTTQSGISQNKKSSNNSLDVAVLLIAFLAGGCSAAQAPTNTSLALTVGSINASLVNMSVGLIIVFFATLIHYRGHLRPLHFSFGVWKYLGGLYGALYVIFCVLATPALGVGVVMGALMFGQLGGGVFLDAFGLMGCVKRKITPWHGLGIALIAIGVAAAVISKVWV